MTWDEIRAICPKQWVIIEAVGAYTEGTNRVVNEVYLIAVFGTDVGAAWKRYAEVHRANREREYYVVHTDRVELDIRVLNAFGRVVS